VLKALDEFNIMHIHHPRAVMGISRYFVADIDQSTRSDMHHAVGQDGGGRLQESAVQPSVLQAAIREQEMLRDDRELQRGRQVLG
jgi:hypothetical protein